ncbi:MAG: hypothetical protein HZB84_10445 [Deltaproteobacteria bacterium]|nr:hypothetical protein [Deltaproteobacteria bacterium]
MAGIRTKRLVEDIQVRNIQYAYETGAINFSEVLRMLKMVVAQHKAESRQDGAGPMTPKGMDDEDV